MLKYEILAVGKMKKDELYQPLFDHYIKQITAPLNLHEIPTSSQNKECALIEDRLQNKHGNVHIMALDEKGKTLTSREFSVQLEQLQDKGTQTVQFIIGGADGLTPSIKQSANTLLSFGKQTWPHMLVRIMLIEQIYRSQQIVKNHPYHRD